MHDPTDVWGLALAVVATLGTIVGCSGQERDARPSPPNGDSSSWQDPSPHRSDFIVANGVRLHYLDWGGAGEPLVFLPGLGATAHYFDDFAPRFRDAFRVYAITLRGHGESDKPPSGYTPDSLARDVVSALDALRLDTVHLAGHSIAGDALTHVSKLYPGRLRTVVYIDAAYDRSPASLARAREYIPRIMAESALVQPTAADSASPAALAAWYRRARRQNIPEAELREALQWSASGRAVRERLPDSVSSQYTAKIPRPDYRQVRLPALAVYVGNDSVACAWPSSSMRHTPAVRRYFDELIKPMGERNRAQFSREAPLGSVVTIPCGDHELPLANADELEKAMRDFFAVTRNR